MSDASEVQPAAEARSAGEVLRPAFVLWLIVVALMGAEALAWAYLDDSVRENSAASVISYELTSLAMVVVVARFAWRDRAACRVFVPPRRGMLELCVLVGIVASMALAMWERSIPPSDWDPTALVEFEAGWPLWACLLAAAVVPAVIEELMFRGVILQRLRAVLDGRLAVAVQAMMFSILHMDMVHLLPHFAFGCLAGFLRIAARALWPCMLMHFLWNGWIVLQVYGVL